MEEIKAMADMFHVSNDWYLLLVPVVIMGIDILTGFLNAWNKDEIKSSKLRSGLTKKFGEMITIIIGMFLEYTIGLPSEIVTFIVIYIVATELISIVENLTKMGVKLPSWLTKRLATIVEESEETNERKD